MIHFIRVFIFIINLTFANHIKFEILKMFLNFTIIIKTHEFHK